MLCRLGWRYDFSCTVIPASWANPRIVHGHVEDEVRVLTANDRAGALTIDTVLQQRRRPYGIIFKPEVIVAGNDELVLVRLRGKPLTQLRILTGSLVEFMSLG